MILNKHLEKVRTMTHGYVNEVREQYDAKFLRQQSDVWNDAKEFLPKDVISVVDLAFNCGGYVAGGFARKLISAAYEGRSTQQASEAYFNIGGDIDLFFTTREDHNEFLNALDAGVKDFNDVRIFPSKGALAVDVRVFHGSSPPKCKILQTVGCIYGKQEEVLSSFDFVNCMVAFDGSSVCFAEDFHSHEMSKNLQVRWFGGASLPFRLRKYVQKYNYTKVSSTLDEVTCLEQLLRRKVDNNYLPVWHELFSQEGTRWDSRIFDAATSALTEELSKSALNNDWFTTLRQAATTRQPCVSVTRKYDVAVDIATNGYTWAVKPDALDELALF